jgi:Dynein heavy chain AAA lid domain
MYVNNSSVSSAHRVLLHRSFHSTASLLLVAHISIYKHRTLTQLLRLHCACNHTHRLVETLFSLLQRGVTLALEYDEGHPDFPMASDHRTAFAHKWLLHSLLWGFGGSLPHTGRVTLSELLANGAPAAAALPDGACLLDYQPRVSDGQWELWSASVPRTEVETSAVADADVVVTTTDTVRHGE